MQLDRGYSAHIHEFKQLYEAAGVRTTPKAHAVFEHVPHFITQTGQPLGPFSEQASESVHSDFSREWQHFKLCTDHVNYADHLLRAVVRYNSYHV
jgi:hypothetical protein